MENNPLLMDGTNDLAYSGEASCYRKWLVIISSYFNGHIFKFSFP
jgi:hypothetical protein